MLKDAISPVDEADIVAKVHYEGPLESAHGVKASV